MRIGRIGVIGECQARQRFSCGIGLIDSDKNTLDGVAIERIVRVGRGEVLQFVAKLNRKHFGAGVVAHMQFAEVFDFVSILVGVRRRTRNGLVRVGVFARRASRLRQSRVVSGVFLVGVFELQSPAEDIDDRVWIAGFRVGEAAVAHRLLDDFVGVGDAVAPRADGRDQIPGQGVTLLAFKQRARAAPVRRPAHAPLNAVHCGRARGRGESAAVAELSAVLFDDKPMLEGRVVAYGPELVAGQLVAEATVADRQSARISCDTIYALGSRLEQQPTRCAVHNVRFNARRIRKREAFFGKALDQRIGNFSRVERGGECEREFEQLPDLRSTQ